MDELFGNLIYLIPAAIIIFRVLSALTGGKKRQEQRRQEEEARRRAEQASQPVSRAEPPHARPADQADDVPDPREELRKLLKNFGLPEPPKAEAYDEEEAEYTDEADVPHWEREKKSEPKPVTVRKIAPLVKIREPILKPAPEVFTAPVDPFPALAVQEKKPAAETADKRGNIIPPGLSRLQEGFVWSEILGSPRGV